MADAKKDLRNVIVFALADGELSDEERRFIDGLRDRAGIDGEAYQELLAEVEAGDKRMLLSRDPAEARRIVDLLVQTAAADEVIPDSQRQLLLKVARHIELDEAVVTAMIDEALAAQVVDDAALDALAEDIYAHFNEWAPDVRLAKIDQLAKLGPQAVESLLRLLESYRTPDGAADALELKRLVVDKLGNLGDARAVYYIAQQVAIGDQDDEITNAALRYASVDALGKLTDQSFAADDAGVRAARAWWLSGDAKRRQYDKLAI